MKILKRCCAPPSDHQTIKTAVLHAGRKEQVEPATSQRGSLCLGKRFHMILTVCQTTGQERLEPRPDRQDRIVTRTAWLYIALAFSLNQNLISGP